VPTTIVRGGPWTIVLPDGWREPETLDNGTVYIDADDESKGIYLTSWTLTPDDDAGSLEAVARSFVTRDVLGLEENEDGWRRVDERTEVTQDGAVVLVDLADANQYRIATKVIARPPLVVRGAFHDYLCDDYAASQAYFAPIIASLSLA
jgi:hypothetical protein